MPSEPNEYQRLSRLLTLLQRANLTKPRRRSTFMEVAGIGHREVAISGILAFLLDSGSDHGMGDLWLRSLLLAAADADPRFDPEAFQTSPSSIPAVKKAALDAGVTFEKECKQDLRVHLYPLDTPDEVLVEAIKPLVKAVLPIAKM